jgi:hypothetical protein
LIILACISTRATQGGTQDAEKAGNDNQTQITTQTFYASTTGLNTKCRKRKVMIIDSDHHLGKYQKLSASNASAVFSQLRCKIT